MRLPKKDYWTERGYKTREEWCESKRNKYFKKNCKKCSICKTEFLGNRSFCSEKCTILGRIEKKENGCWDWLGCKDDRGYGLINGFRNLKNQRTHRVSYQIFVGEIPKGISVCHACDNPSCCNPEHLWLGTHKENMQDAGKKGRMSRIVKIKGENNGRSKLKTKEVIEIISMLKSGMKTQDIASKFKVSNFCIIAIRYGNNWNHVDKGIFEKKSMKGEKNPSRKLKKDDIEEIRRLHKEGVSQKKLGEKYSVSVSTISLIINLKTWV